MPVKSAFDSPIADILRNASFGQLKSLNVVATSYKACKFKIVNALAALRS